MQQSLHTFQYSFLPVSSQALMPGPLSWLVSLSKDNERLPLASCRLSHQGFPRLYCFHEFCVLQVFLRASVGSIMSPVAQYRRTQRLAQSASVDTRPGKLPRIAGQASSISIGRLAIKSSDAV